MARAIGGGGPAWSPPRRVVVATTGRGPAPQTGLSPTVAATINPTPIAVAVMAITSLRRDISFLNEVVHSVARTFAYVEDRLAFWPGGAEQWRDGVVVVPQVGPREPHDQVPGPGLPVLVEPSGGRLQGPGMAGLGP